MMLIICRALRLRIAIWSLANEEVSIIMENKISIAVGFNALSGKLARNSSKMMPKLFRDMGSPKSPAIVGARSV